MTYTHDAVRPADASRPVAAMRLAGKVAALSNWLRNIFRNRSALRQLSEMSDWQLADIGLTRSDIDWVALRAARGRETEALGERARDRSRADVAVRRYL